MSRKIKLFLIAASLGVLVLSSLACESEEWQHSDYKGDLTAEQENELAKTVRFTMGGDVPEGKEVALFLEEATIIGRLFSNSPNCIPLGGNERDSITLRIRDEDTENEWDVLYSFSPIDWGATFRIQISDELEVKVWESTAE